ncbi:hypothetical protein L541_4786 [Bordetella hinzii CA90 BAL1384]|uniref:Uncharacterized protein n=1 Tax=Bordetella hinzii OH87 BAL007II TaxID=1331262 RepID=A0ABR4R5S9_9BORD|nr:hypothetical protein L544_3388 [Bordetella hinzii OH87 BAL007II]KCB28925.1 hypothetical protein L543_3223 [Bordetella hinzii L60]KCB34411.1 hypothetical protein L541_4786 [Bordetella hinzii CA90 BAL1384]KCB41478.1 hypothetical protein L539_3762 [Bordetella hinzii 5132]KCB49455.1 hypothetical protein L538_3407 [Bordetella hinzii 4161]KCB52941.1 hypothetical protein L537_3669 [Bordetella hinzii 1277]
MSLSRWCCGLECNSTWNEIPVRVIIHPTSTDLERHGWST